MIGTVCFIEIPADDLETLKDFYGEMFDWKFEKSPSAFSYYMVDMGPDMPKGGITARQDREHALVNYVKVESVMAAQEKAEKLGAKVVVPNRAIPGIGWYAVLLDPQGNRIGLWQDDTGAA